jgi:rod shape-determining protein MreB
LGVDFLSGNIAIDLGTSRTRIYAPKKGIIMDEPSVVAIEPISREIIAVGEKAYQMLGRTSKKVNVVFPLLGGMICDYYLLEGMTKDFLKRSRRARLIMPKAIICIPGEITDVQKMAAINAIESAGIRKVHVMEAPIAAAIGAGLDIESPHGFFIVNVGAGTTDIAVTSLNGVVSSFSLRIAGDQMDDEIVKYLRRKYNLMIGKKTAEEIKIKIGLVLPQVKKLVFRAKGRDSVLGLPKWVDITSEEISQIISSIASRIVSNIGEMLELTPPELVGDILTDGIYLSGGCAQLQGFKELISQVTGLKVHLVEDPTGCVVKGAAQSIKRFHFI